MKLLFLRGKVPTDRDPKQIMFDNLDDCDDMWTQLANALIQAMPDGKGELWYWGGKRKVKYSDHFQERWIKKFNPPGWTPDVIFARGGFSECDPILKAFPAAFKIYYGAGKRFYPQKGFANFDLILNDTPKHLRKTRKAFPNVRSELWAKPAAENIFKPIESEKKYDVIMVSNKHPHKGHDFAFQNVDESLTMLKVGIPSKSWDSRPNVSFSGWVPRKKIPLLYAQSKVAIVCCEPVDSAPRVIPEAIACNCPILIRNTVNIWREKYVVPQTGKIAKDFRKELIEMVRGYKDFNPYEYYKDNLSMDIAARQIVSYIRNR